MRPESGFINPSASLSRVLLPEPATPKRAFVSPCANRNETPSSTRLSSNARETSSNRIASADGCRVLAARVSSGNVGAGMDMDKDTSKDQRSAIAQQSDQQLGNKEVDHQNQHRRDHHRLSRGATHALSTPARGHPEITADGRYHEPEEHRLDQPRIHVPPHQRLPGGGPVLP